MDQIQHKYITVQGLKLHVADVGTGPNVVLFLHGFPEIWYTWRHQMIALANAGFRAIAPDYRGYGLSDPPPQPEKASFLDLDNDLLAILDALAIPKVFLIGKDFGAWPAYIFAGLHPERTLGVVTMGVPYMPKSSRPQFINHLPEGFYISRWQEPGGRAEADFGRLDAKTVIRNVYILFSRSEIPIASENQEIMDLVDSSTPLPPWFTEENLEVYGKLYEKSGFQTALQLPYRAMKHELGIADTTIEAPALFIMGTKDYVYEFPGMKDYITGAKLKEFVPDLEIVFLPEGTHFVHEQLPDQFFVVAKDYGAWPAYILALLYPERILGVVTLGVPYLPASSRPSSFAESLPEGFYISRFHEPGRAEADFGRFDATTVFRNIYILFSRSEIPIAAENQEIMDLVDPFTPLPPWLSEEDLEAYGDSYERTGFQTALQITYRSKSDDMGITELIVKVPVLVIVGQKDYFLKFPGIEDSVTSGKVKEFATDLELVDMPEGTHFAQEQFPGQFNQLMLTFLQKHI